MTFLRLILMVLILGIVAPQAVAQKAKSRTTQVQKKPASKKPTSKTSNQKQATKKKTAAKEAAPNVNSLEKQRDDLQKKINQSQAQLKKTQAEVKKKLSELSQINADIVKHQQSISLIKTRLDSVNTNITSLETELKVLEAQLKDHKRKYARSMLYMYQNRKASNKMLFLLSAKDFTQMARRYRYACEYSKFQRVQGEMVVRKQAEIEQARQELAQARTRHTQLLQSEQEENRKLSLKQAEQKTTVDGLQKQQKALQTVIQTSQKEMAALNQKIDYYVKLAIEQERKRREEAERKRREAAERQAREAERKRQEAARQKSNVGSTTSSKTSTGSKPATSTSPKSKAEPKAPEPTYNTNDKDYKLTSNFAANRGRLPMPITGSYYISTHFGSYTIAGTKARLDSKGINLTGQPGAQARCIFDGEVSAVFSSGGLKNVMVRHGSYISIYCNLLSVSVREGQHLSSRQTLGAVAADESGKPNLHFQLRNGSSVLNPESWLAK